MKTASRRMPNPVLGFLRGTTPVSDHPQRRLDAARRSLQCPDLGPRRKKQNATVLAIHPAPDQQPNQSPAQLLVRDPQTEQPRIIKPTEVAGGYTVRVVYPLVEVGLIRLVREAPALSAAGGCASAHLLSDHQHSLALAAGGAGYRHQLQPGLRAEHGRRVLQQLHARLDRGRPGEGLLRRQAHDPSHPRRDDRDHRQTSRIARADHRGRDHGGGSIQYSDLPSCRDHLGRADPGDVRRIIRLLPSQSSSQNRPRMAAQTPADAAPRCTKRSRQWSFMASGRGWRSGR